LTWLFLNQKELLPSIANLNPI